MKRPLNILIVEDEAIIALGIQLELEMAGYGSCQVVATGEDAIACVAQDPPDLILMDNRLAGGMDGIQAARAILDLHQLPIIFMTGYAADDIMQRAQSLKPYGYLIKPIRIYEIEPLIDALIQD